jgi:RNA polymerase sigma factor (sigma-70 family)
MNREDESALFRRIYPGLRAFAAVVAPAEDDPDDLVQEALARLLRTTSLSQLDNPNAYLRRSITHLASNRRRSMGRWRRAMTRVVGEREQPASYPSDVSFLEHLAPQDRAVLYLTEVEGWSSAEAGLILGLGENAVNLRRSRSRAKLRDHLHLEADR